MGSAERAAIRVPPRWAIVAPDAVAPPDLLPLRLFEGEGFGDGSHPTTQVCLQALAVLAPIARDEFRLLDFGSGSGILSIAAAAHLGARVDAVEIDERAILHAARNATVNGVADRIRQVRTLDDAAGPYDFIVANILRDPLLSFASELVARLAARGVVVLSGLVSTDVPDVTASYAPLLNERRPEVYERDVWRALVWR